MRKINILLAMFAVALMTACEDPSGLDHINADLTKGEGKAYVLISGNATVAEGSSTDVVISNENPVTENVTVTFSFSGEAQLGTDFTVTSDDVTVTATGGSGEIVFNLTDGGKDNVTFTVNATADATAESAKAFTIELTGATSKSGDALDLGFNGSGKSAVVTITD